MHKPKDSYFEIRSHTRSVLASLACIALCPTPSFALSDADADLVPDAFDNCSVVANGPNDASNQIDTDLDGYGNACDADYTQNNSIEATDYSLFFASLTGPGQLTDHDGNGIITITDFAAFLEQYQAIGGSPEPGPSGLPCAGTVPCTP